LQAIIVKIGRSPSWQGAKTPGTTQNRPRSAAAITKVFFARSFGFLLFLEQANLFLKAPDAIVLGLNQLDFLLVDFPQSLVLL